MRGKRTPEKRSNKFLKYIGLAFQLGLTILVFTFFGVWLDEKYQTNDPWFTIVFSLSGVMIGLYLSLKPLIKDSEKE